MAIPVAKGRMVTGAKSFNPAKFKASDAKKAASFARSDDPAAFGCSAAMSPDRPIPCDKLHYTSHSSHKLYARAYPK